MEDATNTLNALQDRIDGRRTPDYEFSHGNGFIRSTRPARAQATAENRKAAKIPVAARGNPDAAQGLHRRRKSRPWRPGAGARALRNAGDLPYAASRSAESPRVRGPDRSSAEPRRARETTGRTRIARSLRSE